MAGARSPFARSGSRDGQEDARHRPGHGRYFVGMSVIEELIGLEDRVLRRIRECEPLVSELAQLRSESASVGEEMGRLSTAHSPSRGGRPRKGSRRAHRRIAELEPLEAEYTELLAVSRRLGIQTALKPTTRRVPGEGLSASVRHELYRRGWTQRMLAHQIGVHPSTVSSWLAGRTMPAIDALLGLSRILDVSIDELLGHDVGESHHPSRLEFVIPGLVGPDGRPLGRGDRAGGRLEARLRAINDEMIIQLADDPRELCELHPRDFEMLLAELFARDGFDVELTPQSRDRGVDLYAARHVGIGTLLFVVQAKRWAEDRPVGPDMVLSLRGAVDRERATAGVLVTTSHFTPGAEQEQRDHQWRLSLKEYQDLCGWLRGRSILSTEEMSHAELATARQHLAEHAGVGSRRPRSVASVEKRLPD